MLNHKPISRIVSQVIRFFQKLYWIRFH